MRLPFAVVLVAAGYLALLSPVRADDDAAADLAFWQAIQADKDPAELKAYLSAFPNGRYARLAQIQLGKLGDAAAGDVPAGATTGPQGLATQRPVGRVPFRVDLLPKKPQGADATPAQPAPVADQGGDDEPILPEQIAVNPPRGRVGQIIQFTCLNFPDPLNIDKLVVVPAGTPEMDPTRDPADTKVMWSDYAVNCKRSPLKGGPFPPGRYEVRFMTGLYNAEHRYEAKAKADLLIR